MASVAVQSTVVVPSGNVEPEGGAQVTTGAGVDEVGRRRRVRDVGAGSARRLGGDRVRQVEASARSCR